MNKYGEREEFITMEINFNAIRKDSKERSYKENDLYFEPNNMGYHGVV